MTYRITGAVYRTADVTWRLVPIMCLVRQPTLDHSLYAAAATQVWGRTSHIDSTSKIISNSNLGSSMVFWPQEQNPIDLLILLSRLLVANVCRSTP